MTVLKMIAIRATTVLIATFPFSYAIDMAGWFSISLGTAQFIGYLQGVFLILSVSWIWAD